MEMKSSNTYCTLNNISASRLLLPSQWRRDAEEVRPFYWELHDQFWLTICWIVKQSAANYSGFILHQADYHQIKFPNFPKLQMTTNWMNYNVNTKKQKKVRYWMFCSVHPPHLPPGGWERRASIYRQIVLSRISKNNCSNSFSRLVSYD